MFVWIVFLGSSNLASYKPSHVPEISNLNPFEFVGKRRSTEDLRNHNQSTLKNNDNNDLSMSNSVSAPGGDCDILLDQMIKPATTDTSTFSQSSHDPDIIF